jgi:hypothetical protein
VLRAVCSLLPAVALERRQQLSWQREAHMVSSSVVSTVLLNSTVQCTATAHTSCSWCRQDMVPFALLGSCSAGAAIACKAPALLVLPAVVLACRSQSKGDALMKRLAAAAESAGQSAPSLEVSLLDLASLASVKDFVLRWEQQRRPLHILINNAGMFNMGGKTRGPDGGLRQPCWVVSFRPRMHMLRAMCRLRSSISGKHHQTQARHCTACHWQRGPAAAAAAAAEAAAAVPVNTKPATCSVYHAWLAGQAAKQDRSFQPFAGPPWHVLPARVLHCSWPC